MTPRSAHPGEWNKRGWAWRVVQGVERPRNKGDRRDRGDRGPRSSIQAVATESLNHTNDSPGLMVAEMVGGWEARRPVLPVQIQDQG